ncbi:hypothetical protein ACA910_001763 [Epithemia clementina (nom. ined.)]
MPRKVSLQLVLAQIGLILSSLNLVSAANHSVNSGQTSVECGLRPETIKFSFNKDKGLFVEISDGGDGNHTEPVPFQATASTTTADHSEEEVFLARKCWCAQFYSRPAEYCPANLGSCVVQKSGGKTECYKLDQSENLLRALWPVALFWYGFLIFAWFCSYQGQAARIFLCRKIRLGCNKEAEDAALRESINYFVEKREGYKIDRLRRAAIIRYKMIAELRQMPFLGWMAKCLREKDEDENDDDSLIEQVLALDERPARGASRDDDMEMSLELKVKIWNDPTTPYKTRKDGETAIAANLDSAELGTMPTHTIDPARNADAPAMVRVAQLDNEDHKFNHQLQEEEQRQEESEVSQYDADEELGKTCAICLKVLQTGDCIGNITCGHLFHKECLKDWLRRKNRCPLCQRKDIARLKQLRRGEMPKISVTNNTFNETDSEGS